MKRDLKLDSLKGTLVITVILGHISFASFNLVEPAIYKVIRSFIYFFHMPLFLAVSTLFIKESKQWFFDRAKIILIPYFFWFLFQNRNLLIDDVLQFIINLFIGNWSSTKSIIWFLPSLFLLNLIVYYFKRSKSFYKNSLFVFSLVAFLLSTKIIEIHEFIPFGIDVALYMFVLTYFIGILYKKKYLFDKINSITIIIAIIFSSIMLFYFEPIKTFTKFHAIIDFAQFSVATTFIGYISFIVLNMSIFILFFKIPHISFLSLIGKYSFPIFLIHLMVLSKIPMQIEFENPFVNIFFLVIVVVLSIVFPVILSKSLMRISANFKYIGLVK